MTGLLEGTSKVLIEELPVPVENCKKKFWSKVDLFYPELTKPVAASVLFLSHQKTFFYSFLFLLLLSFSPWDVDLVVAVELLLLLLS